MNRYHYYEILPLDVQRKFKANINNNQRFKWFLLAEFTTVAYFFNEAFYWHGTPEGHEYWLELSKQQLPDPMPEPIEKYNPQHN